MLQGQRDKVKGLQELLSLTGLQPDQIAYIGDDLPDYAVIQKVGLAACPSNAVSEIKHLADFKSCCEGGAGAVRELAEYILKAQGKWENTLETMFLHPDPNARHRY